MSNRRKSMDKETLTKILNETIKEADEKKAVAKRIWDWITKHKAISALGATAGLGGAGYGGYRVVKHFKNKKKSSLFDEDVINEIADEIIKEAAEWDETERSVLPKAEAEAKKIGKARRILNWMGEHKLPTGLGAAALLAGGGYGGYKVIKHFKNKKKSSLFDEDVINEIADQIIKEAGENQAAKAEKIGKARRILNWMGEHKLPTGLGAAALLAGGGYGGYKVIKHFKNKKKSSLFDEDDFINLVYDSILKKASEEEDTIDEDQVVDYLADLVDEEELADDYSEDFDEEDFDEEDFDEDDVKLAADLVADAVIDKIAGFTEQGTAREKMKALLHAKASKEMEDIIKKYPGMSYAKLQVAAPVYNKLRARKNAYKSTQKGLNRLKATIPFVGMGRKGQEALENLLKEEKE
jgi:hypothetical protein